MFASAGVEDGERLLVTDLPTLVKGMSVRVSDGDASEAGAPSSEDEEPSGAD